MTNHSLPTDPTGSEGDSEKKKWGYKRQQFDAVISSTRFNGAIDNLVRGTVDVRSLLSILDELNASNQRGRYMAEVLALKQESRRLATVPFDERVVEFLMEGSRRIPWLSDGLASQMAVALASAADNSLYLDTVNAAVGNLLLDLDRPLKPDTRNFLRALTDKIDATRRLQEARGHLATVPSVYPPVLPEQLANAKFPDPPSAEPRLEAPALLAEADAPEDEATEQIEKNQVLVVGESDGSAEDEYEELEPTVLKPGPKYTSQRTLMMPVSAVPPAKRAADAGQVKTTAQFGAALEQPSVETYPTATGELSPSPAQAHTPSEDLAVVEGAITVLADAVAAPEAPQAKVTPPRPHEHGQGTSSKGAVPLPTVASHGPMPVPSRRPPKFLPSTKPKKPESAAAAAKKLGTANQTAPGIGAGSQPSAEAKPAEGKAPGLGKASAVVPVSPVSPDEPSTADGAESLRIPTRGIPIWVMVVAAGGLIAGAAGLWLLTRGSGASDDAAPSASASASAAPANLKSAKARAKASVKAPAASAPPPVEPAAVAPAPPPPAPPPPAPPPAAVPPVPPPAAAPPAPPPAKVTPAPIVRTPAPPPRTSHVAAPPPAPAPKPIAQAPAPKSVAVKPAPTTEPVAPKPKATAEAPTSEPPFVPATPKPSRTIDDILVELLQVPNDPASIEAKAYEVARIVARTTRADAEHILQRLIPEEVLAGTESVDNRALEPVRRVVALLLKKVALDKDDSRAALAIGSLGEWAKLRKHGAAAKLTLDELAESPVVLSRPKRLRALEQVQARLGISNVGE